MMLRRSTLAALVAVLVALVPAVASAADADTIADDVATNGFYADPGADVTESFLGDLVATVRNEGERISFVVLADEPPSGAVTFADNVYDAGVDGVVMVVAPSTVGFGGVSEFYTSEEFEAALDAALDAGGDDAEILETFVVELTGVSSPAPTTGTSSGSSSGGGSWLIWVLLIGAVLIAGFFWLRSKRRTAGPRLDPQLAEAKAAVQKQIDAVANDIIDLEDEVRQADNDEVDVYYAAAGDTYNSVTDAYPSANSPDTLLDLSNQLDEAIWQLDSAEALLDGNTPPPKPIPQTLPAPQELAPEPARSSDAPTGSSLPPKPSYGGSAASPRPDYSRRSGRRSSYGGSGLFNILVGAAGAMMASGNRSRTASHRGGGFGGLGGTVLGNRRPPAPTRRTVSTRRGSSSTSRSSRGSGGRIRGGGRRR